VHKLDRDVTICVEQPAIVWLHIIVAVMLSGKSYIIRLNIRSLTAIYFWSRTSWTAQKRC